MQFSITHKTNCHVPFSCFNQKISQFLSFHFDILKMTAQLFCRLSRNLGIQCFFIDRFMLFIFLSGVFKNETVLFPVDHKRGYMMAAHPLNGEINFNYFIKYEVTRLRSWWQSLYTIKLLFFICIWNILWEKTV